MNYINNCYGNKVKQKVFQGTYNFIKVGKGEPLFQGMRTVSAKTLRHMEQ